MTVLHRLLAAVSICIGVWGLVAPASAAPDEAAAKTYVEHTVADVLAVVRSGDDAALKAAELRAVMEKRAAMPRIAKFAAGRVWREMTEDQRARFVRAFSRGTSAVYMRRFQNYADGNMTVGGAKDRSRRGILISSIATLPQGGRVAVDWLVSDRPGRIVIADIVIEGVSLLITRRDEVAGMLGRHDGDIEKLIAGLDPS